jgi:hypothetical protein
MSTARKERSRRRRGGKATAAPRTTGNPPPVPERRPRRWLAWLLAPFILVGAGILTCALIDNVLWPRIPAALVGTWRAQEGPQAGVTLKFQRNGAFEARMAMGETGAVVHAVAETDSGDDKVLRIVSTDPQTGQKTTKMHLIKSLTDRELVLQDPTGMVSRLVRVE